MELAKVLREGRSKVEMTQNQLAKLMGVHFTVVSSRERGQSEPPSGQLQKFAEVTGQWVCCSPEGEWQIGLPPDPLPGNPERSEQYKEEQPGEGVPMFGRAGAGPGQFVAEEVDEWFDLRRRWLNQLYGLLEIHGDSMAPALADGDLVGVRLFEGGDRPRLGDYVAAWLPEEDTVVVKVWAGVENRRVKLLSTNISYPHLDLPHDEVVIKGRITGALRMGGWRIPLIGYTEYDVEKYELADDDDD